MKGDYSNSKEKISTPKKHNPLFKIVTVGDSEVGKTTFLSSVANKPVYAGNFQKSVGNDYVIKKLILKNEIEVSLEIWDTAGNQKLRTMVSSYYRGAHAVLIMFDNTNLNTFYSIKNWLKEIKQFAPEKCLKFLICNKIDLAASSDTTTYSSFWMLSEEEVENFAKQNSMKYFKISSLNNVGIRELIKTVADDIMDNFDEETLKMRSESFKLGFMNGKHFSNKLNNSDKNEEKNSFSGRRDYNFFQGNNNCCR